MPIEQLLIYIVLAVIFFVKFVVDTFKRTRELEVSGPAKPERGSVLELHAEAQPVLVAVPRSPELPTTRPAQAAPVARARRLALAQPALQHRMVLGNHAELRRAVELIAILGPPRSLAPYDS